MGCPHCEHIDIDSDTYLHQENCPDYAGGTTADQMRRNLHGVTLGMWADTVLLKLPKFLMIRTEVLGAEDEETSVDEHELALSVQWVYPGITLTFEFAMHGTVGVYAVQKIEENNETFKQLRSKSHNHKLRRKGSKSRRSFKRRRK